ncbi:hypothetical protein BVC71_05880 [Marivivens niveibacter]|uniref:Ferredoxin n=1 Tax=Marivivens niveibacter TaxID=1930667 RepID=A0A251X0I7_9RHOB|nr:hypothetical protein BVC71_05880 [Marivivens niveibacter]
MAEHGLRISGLVSPTENDAVPDWVKCIALISPAEPEFWPIFTASDEWRDGGADPLDRWSRRTIGRIACDHKAKAYFPFGGPPFHPFYSWAIRSGSVIASPVTLLVDGTSGLFISYRGAIALRTRPDIELPPPPCSDCMSKPCLTSCPCEALNAEGYDVERCQEYLDTRDGQTCLLNGCAVRRACPIGSDHRPAAQSAYSMAQFKR